jgi:hypothetical protein
MVRLGTLDDGIGSVPDAMALQAAISRPPMGPERPRFAGEQVSGDRHTRFVMSWISAS